MQTSTHEEKGSGAQRRHRDNKDSEPSPEYDRWKRMNAPSVFVETDIIAAFLAHEDDGEMLSVALQQFRVYTSFIQVAEILEVSDHPSYLAAAMDVLSMIRPLGAHPRYAPSIAAYSRLAVELEPALRLRIAICAAISTASKLPVLTVRHESVYLRLDIPTIKPESRR